jgi:hypothetical protein
MIRGLAVEKAKAVKMYIKSEGNVKGKCGSFTRSGQVPQDFGLKP